MSAPAWIWAADGETPYYYEDSEPRPETAVRYVRAENYADTLRELDMTRTALAGLLPTARHYGGLRDEDVAAITRAERALSGQGLLDT